MVAAFPNVNIVAFVVAAVVSWIIGAVYYAPPIFGKTWASLQNKKTEELRGTGPGYLITLVGSFIEAFVLAVFIGYASARTLLDGAMIGLWVWFGFGITSTVAEVVFGTKPYKLYLLNNGYALISFLVMGAIIGAFG